MARLLILIIAMCTTAVVFPFSASVRSLKGVPLLFVNQIPYSPLIYNACGNSEATFHTIELAKKQGFDLVAYCCIDTWITRPEEKLDYRWADEKVEKILSRNPNALIIPRIGVGVPDWWKKEHPEAIMVFQKLENGKWVSVRNIDVIGRNEGISIASSEWRKDTADALKKLVQHLEEKYGDHIIGYMFCGQNTGEWFYYDSWEAKLNCCEPAFEEAFREWLRAKYKSEENLRKAWGEPNLSFEKVSLPSPEERMNASYGFFRDPRKERKLIDFHEFQNIAMSSALEDFAKAIKEATGGRKLVVYFYGYILELGAMPYGVQQSGHLAFKRLLNSPYIDIFVSPISYGDRGAGGIGAFMAAVDSVRLHGKLWLNEDDHRTHIYNKKREDEVRDHFIYGGSDTPEETYWVHQRNFAHIFPRRMGCWYFDLFADGWLDDEGIWENLGKLKRIYDSHLGAKPTFKPEIAVIVDEKSNFYLTQAPPPINSSLLYGIRQSLYRIGAPVGFYLLDDLVEGRVPKSKLYIFLNCFALTEKERKEIERNCQGSTCVFFYANGFIKDPSVDARNMGEILGVKMAMERGKIKGMVRVEKGNKLTEGVEDFGVEQLLSPLFYPQEQVEVIARYEDGMPAVWVRWGKPYDAVYIGTLTAPSSLLRNIAKKAGVHIYSDKDDVVEADESFLSITARNEGERTIRLRKKAEVMDALTGEVLGKSISAFKVFLRKGETRLFLLK
ncbi:MAG: beta-galactosidase [bacterium]